jgi:hypothetical protein
VDLRQGLREVAVTLVGDDDAAPVSATRKLAPVMPTSAARKRLRSLARASASTPAARERALRSRSVERRGRPGHLLLVQMDGRCDQVARRFIPQLDDVLAEIGLHRRDGVGLEEMIEIDLFADHGLAACNQFGVHRTADAQDGLPRRLGILAPMHPPAIGDHLRFEALEIDVEIVEHMVLDGPSMIAQRLELRQARRGGRTALDEVLLHMAERSLQLRRRGRAGRWS